MILARFPMRNIPLKTLAVSILVGIIFLVGGVGGVKAATDPQTPVSGSFVNTSSGVTTSSGQVSGSLAQATDLLGDFRCDGIVTCITQLPAMAMIGISYSAYIIASAILSLAAFMFDAMMALSIDSTFIAQGFIDDVWIIIRDFSNMAFIFVLLYAGIQTMFSMGDWRQTILRVIIIALLINFSLFFTKVVIDAGNVLAVGVYDAMGAKSPINPHTQGAVKEKSLSEILVSQFGPQKIFKAAAGTGMSAYLIVAVFWIGVAINLLAAWAFFRVALIFIGRIIGFWFLMIISPFAFISITFPKGGQFNDWLKNLLGLSFVAPVFLFFLYIILTVLTKGNILNSFTTVSSSDTVGFSLDALFGGVVMVIFIYLALDKSVKYATEMSGAFGNLGAQIGGAVMGVAAGGTAFVGQKVIGRKALEWTQSDKFKGWAAKSGVGRVAYTLADKTAGSAFDVRNIPIGGKALGAQLGIGSGDKGNFVKTVEEAKKADIAFGKKITTNKEGKPIMVTDAKGEQVTATVAYANQLEKGYATRIGTGGNIGATKAAESLLKTEKKRAKLASKEKDNVGAFKSELGLEKDHPDYDKDLDSPEIEKLVEDKINILEQNLAKAQAKLDVSDKNNVNLRAGLIVDKKKAEKKLSKFENARKEIEKTKKELKELTDEKKGEKEKEH